MINTEQVKKDFFATGFNEADYEECYQEFKRTGNPISQTACDMMKTTIEGYKC